MNRIGAEGEACTEPTTIPAARSTEDFMKKKVAVPLSILAAEHRELVVPDLPRWLG